MFFVVACSLFSLDFPASDRSSQLAVVIADVLWRMEFAVRVLLARSVQLKLRADTQFRTG
jgi:hypothetical protein